MTIFAPRDRVRSGQRRNDNGIFTTDNRAHRWQRWLYIGSRNGSFADRLLNEELIATIPGEGFGEAARGHIRVAMTIADDEFAEAFERLLAFAERNLEES